MVYYNQIESRDLYLLQIYNKIYLVTDSISLLFVLQIYNKIYFLRDLIRLLYLLQIYNNKIHVVRHMISLIYEL